MKNKQIVFVFYGLFLLSYLLDGLISSYFPYIVGRYNSISLPSFITVMIVLLFPFATEKEYLLYPIGIFGLLYDLVYIGEIGIYVFTFYAIYLIVKGLYYFLNENLFNNIAIVILSLLAQQYIVATIYFMLRIFQKVSYQIVFERFISSILINVIYTIIMFGMVRFIFTKLRLR